MRVVVFYITLFAILGGGLIAGTFFVFSVAIMGALKRLPLNDGISAMKSINVVILNPIFLGVFLGTAVASALIAIHSVLNWDSPGSGHLLAGSLLYLLGSFFVTMVFNVPLNNALAAAEPDSAAGQAVWENYLTAWTYWNHVRTIASLASTAFLVLGLINHSR